MKSLGNGFPYYPSHLEHTSYKMDLIQVWPWLLLAFILFRFFDIVKLGPVKWADDRNDALGVMLDDIFAGLIVAFMLIVSAWFYYGY